MNKQDEDIKTFDVSGEGLYQHEIGNPDCQVNWCNGGFSWPKRCRCGGLIHADFNDETADGDYTLYEKCDSCGKDFMPMDYVTTMEELARRGFPI